MTRDEACESYALALESNDKELLRSLCQRDLFFLLVVACKRRDVNRDWLFERCKEVDASPDGFLDLWARDHYKSSIITFAKSIQDILREPEITIGIFSHTRPIAKGFLGQIKTELETNDFLKDLFPDVLYQNPKTESPKWSLDYGIVVKRKTNPKEATVEAWGLVDGQPTGKHFALRVYDDVVTRESVTTPDQIKKTTMAWELSLNLGAHGGKVRYIGTKYHVNDTYRTMVDRGSAIPRIHAATSNGKVDGEPVLLSAEVLAEKRRDMGPYTFACQLLQDPVADQAMNFKLEWIKTYESLGPTAKWNKYILVDPASKKKQTSDFTVMEVIGLAPDGNFYLLDAIRDRLNLTARAKKVFELVEKWNPLSVGYESYGLQADVEHIQYLMEQRNYRFNIIELGGRIPKEDRIRKLVPIYEQGRFYSPKRLVFADSDGKMQDYVELFMNNEFLAFPVCVHDDMLDCRARILDPALDAKFPKMQESKNKTKQFVVGAHGTGWMG